ncbi:MAG: hypothetical protein JSV44_01695, partial [Candidatus Zixiibacteriota bacterium]
MKAKSLSANVRMALIAAIAILTVPLMLVPPVQAGMTVTLSGPLPDTIICGQPVTFEVHMFNDAGQDLIGIANGFEVYSLYGAQWQPLVADTAGGLDVYFDLIVSTNYFSVTGSGADTVGFGAASIFPPHLPGGYDDVVLLIETQVDCSEPADFLCIDSCWFPPGNSWMWNTSTGPYLPGWGGPYCFPVGEIYNEPPVITNCPGEIYGNACDAIVYDFEAVDPDPGDQQFWSIEAGPGTIDVATGLYVFTPSGTVGTFAVIVRVSDLLGEFDDCDFYITTTSEPPFFDNTCDDTIQFMAGIINTYQFDGVDPDNCPLPLSYALVNSDAPGGVVIDVATGLLEYVPPLYAAGNTYFVDVEISDGYATAECRKWIDVLPPVTSIKIERATNAPPGGEVYVSITIEDVPLEMGGFDFLISFDPYMIFPISANPGQLLEDCEWEYFTYQLNAIDGLIRIVSIADINNGAYHPVCFGPPDTDPHELARIKFAVSPDAAPGDFEPIRFHWNDCSDNAISNVAGDVLYIDRAVYDFDGTLIWDEEDDVQFPEEERIPFVGTPDYCFEPPPEPNRFLDFYYGGVGITMFKDIKIARIDFYHEGAPIAEDSDYGEFSLVVIPQDSIKYINAVFDSAGWPQWLVRNMPVWPAALAPLEKRQKTLFDGIKGGFPYGPSVSVYVWASDTLVKETITPDDYYTMPVGDAIIERGGFTLEPQGVPAAPLDLDIIDFTVPLLPIHAVFYDGMGNVETPTNGCAPAAMANSLHWLADKYGFDVGNDPEATLDELSDDMNRGEN